jgi:hypothetical protein
MKYAYYFTRYGLLLFSVWAIVQIAIVHSEDESTSLYHRLGGVYNIATVVWLY